MIWLWVQTGFVALGLAGVMMFMARDKKNRLRFQQATSFKIKNMGDKIEVLSQKTAKNEQRIDKIEAKPTENSIFKAEKAENTLKSFKNAMAEALLVKNEPPKAVEDEKDYTDTVIKELIRHAVKTEQIEMFLQPVRRLPQRQVRYYEIFARLRARAGVYLPANQYMDLAVQDKMAGEIDKLLLLRCLNAIEKSAQANRNVSFFINVTGATLKNPAFMKALLGFIASSRNLAPRLIFEMKQSDYQVVQGPVLEILRGLGKLGCSFSLDHVQKLEFDVDRLMHDKVRFIKVSSETLRQAEPAKMIKIRRNLEGNGINLIAERIEGEREIKGLNDIGISYGQGHLLGRPAPEDEYRKRAA